MEQYEFVAQNCTKVRVDKHSVLILEFLYENDTLC